MSLRKAMRRIHAAYGQIPDVEYFDGDLARIRTYSDFLRLSDGDSFTIDDGTWNDLNMDAVYRRINTGLSTAGEQVLYAMLRRPLDREAFARQRDLIELVDSEPETRMKLQKILYRLGCWRQADLSGILRSRRSPLRLLFYILFALLPLLAVSLAVLFAKEWIWASLACVVFNGIFHEIQLHRRQAEIQTVNYCVSLACALRKIRKLRHAKLDHFLKSAYGRLRNLRPVLRIGTIESSAQNDIASLFLSAFLLDLIFLELLKNHLSRRSGDLLSIHDAVGRLDAAIAIASFRRSISCCAVPQIDFDANRPFLHAEQVVHPLIQNPVPNDIQLERPLLITGANASGKTTYLKACMLCALLAQTICTAPAVSYQASPFRIYTSMAISDDLLQGESYYIAEIRSLKRILNAHEQDNFVLSAIDEVLRGTNTVERIAASAEILTALRRKGILCIVATHDAELCSLSGGEYDLAHFQGTITECGVQFDYLMRPGAATERNAIELLRLMGFDAEIVEAAHSRARDFERNGQWR